MARPRNAENALNAPTSAKTPNGKKRSAAAKAQTIPLEGRVVIDDVRPRVDCGRTPVKRVLGDEVEVSADIFSDGHDLLGARLLYRFAHEPDWRETPMRLVENDRWSGRFKLERRGACEFVVEAWRDVFASWASDAKKKIDAAATDLALVALEGGEIVDRAAKGARTAGLRDLRTQLASCKGDTKRCFDILFAGETQRLMANWGPREDLAAHPPSILSVDRPLANFSAWYELFPRSMSPDPSRHGRLSDVIDVLPYIRELGFDILYLPPIHPIGVTNRKGRNNALRAAPEDVGSVYAIGSPEGGHDAIHPQLGTLEDFQRLVAAAKAQGLEIALDFAVQCSLDHPWIRQRPEWFNWRPDATIRFAENPPKKYEDIVSLNLAGPNFREVWSALRDVVRFWIRQGVRVFRVDNPHTKPISFWRWLITEIVNEHPDVLFLSEAFTKPKMMKALAKAGFHQSYTYFTWRNTKWEIIEYLLELTGDMAEYFRPNFFVNTPDINPFYLQTGGPAAFMVRATLAATLSSNWGMYSGFEFGEATPVPGREEYLNSEKYEVKHISLGRPTEIGRLIGRINEIRRENPALHDLRETLFTNAFNDQILAYARMTRNRDNVIFVMVNLDPHNAQETSYEIPLWEFGLPDHATIDVEDLLLGIRFQMHGKVHQIRLEPWSRPVVIWRLIGPPRPEQTG